MNPFAGNPQSPAQSVQVGGSDIARWALQTGLLQIEQLLR